MEHAMVNRDCTCRKGKCPRHGDCAACRAHHKESGRCVACERKLRGLKRLLKKRER